MAERSLAGEKNGNKQTQRKLKAGSAEKPKHSRSSSEPLESPKAQQPGGTSARKLFSISSAPAGKPMGSTIHRAAEAVVHVHVRG